MPDDLDRARALKEHLERSAAVEQKNVERLQGQRPPANRGQETAGRTTSASKHYDPDALSRARAAKEHFTRAAAGQEKNVQRAQNEKIAAERQPSGSDRTTSAAKHYSPDALSRARAAKDHFTRAAAGEQQREAGKEGSQSERQTRHTPAPAMHLQPKNPAQRDGPNRQTFDNDRNNLYKDELGKALREQREAELRKAKEQDRDRERE